VTLSKLVCRILMITAVSLFPVYAVSGTLPIISLPEPVMGIIPVKPNPTPRGFRISIPSAVTDDKANMPVKFGSQARKTVVAQPKASKNQPGPVIDRRTLSRHQRISNIALSFRGSAYVWGGMSTRYGFDCSGLTRFLYLKEGIDLPHSAKLQFQLGRPVSVSELKVGDLVFFNTTGPLTHVGMYIGDGKFVHASGSRRGVRIDSLSGPFYKKRFAGARRYK
jgi:cell wall-associated NlpC family hydrolase